MGVFSSFTRDVEFEVKFKGFLFSLQMYYCATYICFFVAVVPTAANHNGGHCWPGSWPGGQLFPRSDSVFLTVDHPLCLLASNQWAVVFFERASTPTTA